MTPIPDQRSGAASGPQDIAARRLRRLARLLTSTGRPAEGIAARYQKAFGRRVVLSMDVFSVLRENQTAALGASSQMSFGGRIKVLTKF